MPSPDAPEPDALTNGKAAHTAGEWMVWPSLYEGMAAAVVHDAEPLKTVAEVRDYADARLIAVAPDGLALARMIVEWTEASGIQGPLYMAATALIAKAEGRP